MTKCRSRSRPTTPANVNAPLPASLHRLFSHHSSNHLLTHHRITAAPTRRLFHLLTTRVPNSKSPCIEISAHLASQAFIIRDQAPRGQPATEYAIGRLIGNGFKPVGRARLRVERLFVGRVDRLAQGSDQLCRHVLHSHGNRLREVVRKLPFLVKEV